MRKIIYVIANISICLSILLSLTFFTLPVKANTEYRRIITEDTPFYSDSGGTNLLFNLPYTYYVKLLEHGEILSHVECFGAGSSVAIDGYVPTDKLFDDDLPVQNPYMEKEIMTISTAVLYSDKNLTTPLQYIFASRTLKFYGQIPSNDGSIIFYVGYNNRLGYVQEKDVLPFEIQLHPNELTFIQPDQPSVDTQTPPENENSTTTGTNLTTIRIIVIACLLLAGLVALFIAIKNKPKKHLNNGYYDENEYE